MVAAGTTRPDWCFVLEREGRPVGRVGFRVEDTCPPQFLGDLPAREVWPFGLELPWADADWLAAGRALLGGAVERVRPDLPEPPQARINAELHDHVEQRRAVLEAVGMTLFQEKRGFLWTDGGTRPEVPDRLRFRSVRETGREAYRAVLGRAGAGTLDRNDAWYRRLAGEANWSAVFMTFLDPPDEPTWLLGELPGGTPVGIVAVSPFGEPDTATVVFIGVVPEQRRHGYVRDLLLAGTAAARDAGFTAVLSDADVLNAPMAAAFEATGHRGDARAWHVWHYRLGDPAAVSPSGR
jgi:RimJ/RimL family protein N-acetyltransferase